MIDRTEKKYLIAISVCVVLFSMFLSWVIIESGRKTLYNIENSIYIESNNDFQYALDTQYPGGIWGMGDVELSPISIPELSSSYGNITKILEVYTEHKEYVCDRYETEEKCDTDSKGRRSCRIVKTSRCASGHWRYWLQWDYKGAEVFTNDKLLFMGKEFSVNQVSIGKMFEQRLNLDESSVLYEYKSKISWNYLYQNDSLIHLEHDKRWYYLVVPLKFSGNLYIRSTENGYVNSEENGCGCNIVKSSRQETIVEIKSGRWFVEYVLWWLLPLLTIIFSVLYFYNN